MIVKEVNRKAKLVTIDGDYWTVTIVNGKVVAQIGFLNPVQNRKAHKLFHSIIKA